MKLNKCEIQDFLEEKVMRYNRAEFIETDPIQIPHVFSKKEDIEIAAFLSSSIAWGNRKAIIKSAQILMQRMDYCPYDFIIHSSQSEINHFSNFTYRTFNGIDCMFFIRSLKNIYKNHQGLQQVFEKTICEQSTVEEALVYFRKIFLDIVHEERSEKHIPDITKNSAAKRLNMFLRWMVRKDKSGVDFGLWKGIKMSQLVLPLDLHSGNVARKLGLLTRQQNDLKAVKELMDTLREFDPDDPVKYDFALFGLGVFEKF